MKQSGISEFVEQCHVVRWLSAFHPTALYTASCAGMRTSIGVARKMKASGAKAGVPDLMIFEQRRGYAGLFIEMKREHGGTVSPEQKEWLEYLNERWYMAVVCRGYNDAIKVIGDYLK